MSSQALRQMLINWLKLIASFEEQRKFEQSVPIANVPAELVCVWFESYLPETALCRKAFSAAELSSLNEFHNFFEQCYEQLPDTLENMQSTAMWRALSNKAQDIIVRFNW